MNKNNAQSIALRARDKARSLRNKIAGVSTIVAGAMYSAGAMAAGADPGAAILSEITGAKATVGGILVALAAVLGLFLLWSMIKRAK